MRRYLLTSKPSGEFVGNANQTLWGVGIAEGSRTIVDSVAGWAWLPERMTPFVKAWNAAPPEPTALDWQHSKSRQRDYTAEAAGY